MCLHKHTQAHAHTQMLEKQGKERENTIPSLLEGREFSQQAWEAM